MPRRRRRKSSWFKRIALALLAIPLAYLAAALIGALIPVNRGWVEPNEGTTIYLADNGVHVDIVVPVQAQGLDWAPLFPGADFRLPPDGARWIAFGAGERRVYLNTPTWADVTPRTLWAALSGGERVMHVEWVKDPTYATRAVKLTPEQYRRLWAAIRAGFRLDAEGKPIHIDHPGYWGRDAFYEGVGKASAIDTCNQWAASRLRLAGVKVSAWTPFAPGLMWRFGESDQRT